MVFTSNVEIGRTFCQGIWTDYRDNQVAKSAFWKPEDNQTVTVFSAVRC